MYKTKSSLSQLAISHCPKEVIMNNVRNDHNQAFAARSNESLMQRDVVMEFKPST